MQDSHHHLEVVIERPSAGRHGTLNAGQSSVAPLTVDEALQYTPLTTPVLSVVGTFFLGGIIELRLIR